MAGPPTSSIKELKMFSRRNLQRTIRVVRKFEKSSPRIKIRSPVLSFYEEINEDYSHSIRWYVFFMLTRRRRIWHRFFGFTVRIPISRKMSLTKRVLRIYAEFYSSAIGSLISGKLNDYGRTKSYLRLLWNSDLTISRAPVSAIRLWLKTHPGDYYTGYRARFNGRLKFQKKPVTHLEMENGTTIGKMVRKKLIVPTGKRVVR